MTPRANKQVIHGIRPHMFNLWADDLMVGIEMQHDRLLEHGMSQAEMDDLEEPTLTNAVMAETTKVQADFAFYFTAVRRLLRVCVQARAEGYGGRNLELAIAKFKGELPGLVDVRNSLEHADDFLRTGRLQNGGLGYGGGDASFRNGEHRFELSRMSPAVRVLYAALKANVTAGAPDAPVPLMRPGEAQRAIREAIWFAPEND